MFRLSHSITPKIAELKKTHEQCKSIQYMAFSMYRKCIIDHGYKTPDLGTQGTTER